MTSQLTGNVFDQLHERELRKLRAIQQLREIGQEFPDLIQDLLAAMNARANGSRLSLPKRKADRANPGTAFDRVVRVYIENNNDHLDTGELTRRSGISRNVLATILWSNHRDEFEQKSHPTHKKMKMWRLKPDRFDALQHQQRMFENESSKEQA